MRRQATSHELDRDVLNEVIWGVERMSRFVPAATCLVQAIAAYILLNQAGQATDLRVGVAKNKTGTFLAHAWLEYQGAVLLGDRNSPSRFTTLPLFE
jgi:hypothetical protein